MCAIATVCPYQVEEGGSNTRYHRFCHKQHEINDFILAKNRYSGHYSHPGMAFPEYPPSAPMCSTYDILLKGAIVDIMPKTFYT